MQDDYGNTILPPAVKTISARFDDGDARMGRIEGDVAAVRAELEANTRTTQAVADSTAELVDFFRAMKGAMKVLNWSGKLARPLGAIVGLGAAVLAAVGAAKGMR